MRLSIPRWGSNRGGGSKNRQDCLNASVKEIHQFENFLWGVSNSITFIRFCCESGHKKEGSSLKRGLLTTIIYFGVFNYILKTSYGDYVVKRWLFQ